MESTRNENAVDVKALSEDEALGLVGELADRFGWVIPFLVTRGEASDVVDELRNEGLDPASEDGWGLSDNEWDVVRSTSAWQVGISEVAWERAGDAISDAIHDAVTEAVRVPAESTDR